MGRIKGLSSRPGPDGQERVLMPLGVMDLREVGKLEVPFEVKDRKLSVRQRRILEGVVLGKETKVIAKELGTTKERIEKSLESNNLKNALGVALERAGLTDDKLARKLKKTMGGAGYKPTNGDAIRAIEIAAKMKGYLGKEETGNTYINELKILSIGELEERAKGLLNEIKNL